MKHPHVSGHSLSNTRSVVRNPFKLPGTNQEPEKWNGSWDGSNTRFLCSPHLVEMAFGPSGDPSLAFGYKSLLFPLDAIPAWSFRRYGTSQNARTQIQRSQGKVLGFTGDDSIQSAHRLSR